MSTDHPKAYIGNLSTLLGCNAMPKTMLLLLCLVPMIFLTAGCSKELESGINYEDARDKPRDNIVRQNMRTMQSAVERYAAEHGGNTYPSEINQELKTYFPGGVEGRRESPVGPINPFSAQNEFPTVASVVKDVEQTRNGKRFEVPAGKVYYCLLDNGQSYAIVGGAHDGKVLMDENNPDQVLVFSNK
jgi:hypothetical protein